RPAGRAAGSRPLRGWPARRHAGATTARRTGP
ncbi:regulator of ribonuclease activity A, partial [Propionibacterium freudenreichii]|nr:regulator of ribonuclease activity A [Propionibacterium freudenreichii]